METTIETTIIVRIKKYSYKKLQEMEIKTSNTTDDKIHKNATSQLSGNYLIILEGDLTQENPLIRTVYNLSDVVSWSSRKIKRNSYGQ